MKSGFRCKPNLFIVGAPKSGTTSLHYYLSQHPDVFMSSRKEPCFLAPDFSAPSYPQTEEAYLSCFEGHKGEIRVGESTTSYLYSRFAARRIHEYSPDAKIIVLLRNPADMVASLHNQYVKMGRENITHLQDALEAEMDREQGKRIPIGFGLPKEYLLYQKIGQYATQLKRYLSEFERRNIHVVIFDDFQEDTAREFSKVCEFLGVSTECKVEFTLQNPGQTPRVFILQRLALLLRPILFGIASWLRPAIPSARFGPWLWALYRKALKKNLKSGRIPMPPETRIALASYYEQEIRELEDLLGRDLSCWRITEKNLPSEPMNRP